MLRLLFFLFIFLLAVHSLHAQEKLSLADAISIALNNNYSILISKNNAAIAGNDNTIGNAGMLPTLDLNAAANQSVNNTKQEFSNGNEIDGTNAETNLLNASADFQWTIFNGFKMFATRRKLGELARMGELNSKIEIENTLARIIATYFDVVRFKDLIKAGENTLAINEERVRISETKFNIGSASKLELLQSKVDLNAQRSVLLKERTALYYSKITLNQILARPVDTDFDPTDSITITYQPKLEELRKTFVSQNKSLIAAQQEMNMADYSLKEFQSQRYPLIYFGASYNYTRVENQVGFILYNENKGLNYGLNITWNLFNGFNTNRQVKNAKLEYQNASLHLSDVKSQVETSVLQAFRIFQDAVELLKLEEENVVLARENATVGLERFRIGKSTNIELQEALKSLEDAENRTTSARYAAKISETELMRLNGELVK